ASDKCQREKRKTINGDDLLWAMATLGFEDYIEPLKLYLNRYREMEGDTKGSGKGHEGSSRKDGVQHDYNEHVSIPISLFNKQISCPSRFLFAGSGLWEPTGSSYDGSDARERLAFHGLASGVIQS
ncbi:nuclear transcription factor Y subunit B-10-like protein isoform X1, partial [Tanacetum coccineum]